MPKLDCYIRGLLGNPAQFKHCHSQENLRVLHPPDQFDHHRTCPRRLDHDSRLLEKFPPDSGKSNRVTWGRFAISAKGIFGAGDEDAGATGLAPDALVARSRRTVIVVAREELALVDPQLTVE